MTDDCRLTGNQLLQIRQNLIDGRFRMFKEHHLTCMKGGEFEGKNPE
jgi:hypothetical protein